MFGIADIHREKGIKNTKVQKKTHGTQIPRHLQRHNVSKAHTDQNFSLSQINAVSLFFLNFPLTKHPFLEKNEFSHFEPNTPLIFEQLWKTLFLNGEAMG